MSLVICLIKLPRPGPASTLFGLSILLRYNAFMNLSEFKKTVNAMTAKELADFLVEFYKNQPKDRKELVEISVENFKKGKELPAKTARIPDLKKTKKALDYIEMWGPQNNYPGTWIKASVRRKLTASVKECWDDLKNVPSEAACFDQASRMLVRFLIAASESEESYSGYAGYGFSILNALHLSWTTLFQRGVSILMSPPLNLQKIRMLIRLAVMVYPRNYFLAASSMEILTAALNLNDTRLIFCEEIEDALLENEKESWMDPELRLRYVLFWIFLQNRVGTSRQEMEEQAESLCSKQEFARTYAAWLNFEKEQDSHPL